MSWVNDTIKIRGEDVPVKRGSLEQFKLKFYAENPRLFSIVRPDESEPDQEEIQKRLVRMDHVKALIQDIKSNGGLIDPIIVRDVTFEVLEGNSRLAAYRRLVEKDPITWAKIKCVLLPNDINESKIFSILGQYHITGKKDWSPFEQAGFLYRRHTNHGIQIEQISNDIGLPKKEIKLLIETYQFMINVNDTDINKWSYYYEFKKSRKIASLRKNHPSFEEAVVSKIKSGEISKAVDVRDGVAKLANAKDTLVKKFVSGETSLEDALDRMEVSGNADGTYQRMKRFRQWLVTSETEASITQATAGARNKISYELKHIKRTSERMLKNLS